MKRWRIKLTPGDAGQVYAADTVRTDGGVLTLENGDVWKRELILAIGVGHWNSVQPEPETSP